MFLWFVGVGLVLVWAVFRDPAIDYRVVVAGVLVPDAVALIAGRAAVGHTLFFSVVLLTGVMLATRRRRAARRRYLALPIGTFAHLLLDGVWTRTALFWWPLFGVDFPGSGVPSLTRPLVVTVVLELVGSVALVWWVRHFRLHEPARRAPFLRTGRLGRDFRPGAAGGIA